ncbi:UDP-galactose phosphate transferase [Patiriisocius marinistellae]|uniref:UDP-galactose phosphate transferase n=1 Tax=Patiriisocius marinistellae TaxID=2494560 RepID=A0A5J4FY72_9FLAO|nr:sugar transferase [Patiriisocius marinistellae]GEQ87200.1 UDP-galactose phosphate transferase [Patiriisocius marinistellae]
MYLTVIKPLLDKVFFILLTPIFLPLYIVVAVLTYIKIGSPIIFSQKRIGKDEKIFKMYKFRSMTNEKNEDGTLKPDQERITKFGAFLRLSSLDELPGLFNVLLGNMSFVGPRPLLVHYLPYYTEREKKRHQVRPGITGLAQVNGRNTVQWDDRLEMDAVYVENISFINDVKILFKTAYKVIKKEDVVVIPGKLGGQLHVYRANKINSDE